MTADADRSTPALVVTRAARGAYSPDVLALTTRELPELGEGELLLTVLYLSLDPTNRNWLKLEPVNTLRQKIGRDLAIGEPMVGELLGRVEESRHEGFRPGDVVAGVGEWQERVIVPGDRMRSLERGSEPLASHLTVFSHIGLAAMVGLHAIAGIRPGETVVVSAAAGATGRLAVAAAAAHGCRVIGIAGGPEKCDDVVRSGAAVAIDYRAVDDLAAALAEAAPEGVDVYFDNVGGRTLDAMLTVMKPGGRVAVCGVMSDYDAGEERHGLRNMFQVLVRHLRIEGFLAGHYWERRAEFYGVLRDLLERGLIEHRSDEAVGLAAAPEHLGKLFAGTNRGKLLVRVAAGELSDRY